MALLAFSGLVAFSGLAVSGLGAGPAVGSTGSRTTTSYFDSGFLNERPDGVGVAQAGGIGILTQVGLAGSITVSPLSSVDLAEAS